MCMAYKKDIPFVMEGVEGSFLLEYTPFGQKVYFNEQLLSKKGIMGKYEVPLPDGERVPIRVAYDMTFTHYAECQGNRMMLEGRLKTYEYIVGALPLLLVVAGGFLGAVFGVLGVNYIYGYMRQSHSVGAKLLIAIVISAICYLLYFTFGLLFYLMLQGEM